MNEGHDLGSSPLPVPSAWLPGAAAEPPSAIARAHRLPRVSWLNAESRVIEALAVSTALLVPAALILPIWLMFGSPAHEGEPVNRFLAACQMGVERGLLGVPGYAAALLLFAWGLFAIVRLVPAAVRTTVRLRRSGRQHGRSGKQSEMFLEGRAVPFSLLPNREPIAFTAGLLRPRVYLSRGLFRSLSLEEQNAVLVHELAHARRRDPLRCLLVEVMFQALLLPASHRWSGRYRALREVRADLSAITASHDPGPLLRALNKVAPVSPLGACGMNEADVGGIVALRAFGQGVTRREVLVTFAGFTGLVLLAAVAVVGLTDWQSFFFCPLTGGDM